MDTNDSYPLQGEFAPALAPHLSRKRAREELEKLTVKLFRPIHPPQATLRLIKCSQPPYLRVSKSYLDCSPLYCNTIGRALIAREYAIYRRLQGVQGIPQYISRPHPECLEMEYIEGEDLRTISCDSLPQEALGQMRQLLHDIHERGIIHFDLGHDAQDESIRAGCGRDFNVLYGKDQHLYLIDFAGSLRFPTHFRRFSRMSRHFDFLAAHDNLVLQKIMLKFYPQLYAQTQPCAENGQIANREFVLTERQKRLFKKLGK